MTELDALLMQASRYGRPSLRLVAEPGHIVEDHAGELQSNRTADSTDFVTLASVSLSASTAQSVGLPYPGGVAFTFTLSNSWLAEPVASPNEAHRLAISNSSVAVDHARIMGQPFTIRPHESLPTSYDLSREGLSLDRPDADLLDNHLFERDEEMLPSHQVLGYFFPAQLDVVETAARDLENAGDDDSAREMRDGLFLPLLQIDSDESISLTIGDLGRLYIFVERPRPGSLRLKSIACMQAS